MEKIIRKVIKYLDLLKKDKDLYAKHRSELLKVIEAAEKKFKEVKKK